MAAGDGSQVIDIGTFVTAADLSALQYTFVTLDATGKVIANATLGGKVLGVLQNKPTSGQVAQVRVIGITKVKAGAAVTSGAKLMSDGGGLAITAATTGSTIVGVLGDQSAGASGDLVMAFVNCGTGVV